jgi:hypothetical protein
MQAVPKRNIGGLGNTKEGSIIIFLRRAMILRKKVKSGKREGMQQKLLHKNSLSNKAINNTIF